MFENIERDADERGQVGIGTLIVFIALVLVAAIAAGVLINTAGFLQNQAESTGEESTQQVSNNVEVLSATGSMTSSGGPVDTITITVSVGPGSDPVDLEGASYQLLNQSASSQDGSASTTFGGSDDTIQFQNTDGSSLSDGTITEGEQVQIVINTGNSAGDAAFQNQDLPEGVEAEFTITTADGSQTTEILTAPDPIDGDDDVRL
jgi:flagellin FlaB